MPVLLLLLACAAHRPSVGFHEAPTVGVIEGVGPAVAVIVSDADGVRVPGAWVVVDPDHAGRRRTAATDRAGEATLGGLRVDTHTVVVTADGFNGAAVDGVATRADAVTLVQVVLWKAG